MLSKLKPCPCCGSADLIVDTFDCEDREGWPTTISCNNCGLTGPWHYTPNKNIASVELINAWNDRFVAAPLMPCPFCNSTNLDTVVFTDNHDGIVCENCGATGYVKSWNYRPSN